MENIKITTDEKGDKFVEITSVNQILASLYLKQLSDRLKDFKEEKAESQLMIDNLNANIKQLTDAGIKQVEQ